MDVRQGDTIEVLSNKVDQPNRRGVVQAVLEDDPQRLEITWDDGRTSEFVPSGGNLRVLHRAR